MVSPSTLSLTPPLLTYWFCAECALMTFLYKDDPFILWRLGILTFFFSWNDASHGVGTQQGSAKWISNTKNTSNAGLGMRQNGDIRKQQGFWGQLQRTQIMANLSDLLQDFRVVPCRQRKCLKGFGTVMCQHDFFFHIGIKSHLREEGLILAPSSEGFSLWWTSHGGEGTRQLGTLLPQLVSYLFPFLFIPELQLMGWYGPHSGWVFCPQLNLSGNTLIETSPRLFKI